MTTQIAYLEAAADALVAHLQNALDTAVGAGVVTVLRGWPNLATPIGSATTERARVAVTAGRPEVFPVAAYKVSQATIAATDDAPESWEVRFATARWTCPLQIDAFALDRDGRDELARVIDEALHPLVPSDSALTLTCAAYHDVQARIVVDSEDGTDNGVAALSGRWRQRIECTARGIKVACRVYAKATEIDLTIAGETTVLEPAP
jgi:hypothetical protein